MDATECDVLPRDIDGQACGTRPRGEGIDGMGYWDEVRPVAAPNSFVYSFIFIVSEISIPFLQPNSHCRSIVPL